MLMGLSVEHAFICLNGQGICTLHSIAVCVCFVDYLYLHTTFFLNIQHENNAVARVSPNSS